MAKINKYWGFVAVGALTAAAAGAVAALIAKKGSCKEDFDFEDDFDDFDLNEDKEEKPEENAEEAAEAFQSWEHTGEQTDEAETSADPDSSENVSGTAGEVEIKDAEVEAEDADEPSHFEEAIDAASESEE